MYSKDGAYVLGWAWFGGVRFNGESYFGDYYSCSYVTIKGGGFDDVCHRIFEPEKGRTTCLSSTNKLGVCVREPCFVPRGREMIPALFEGGTPPPIHRPFGLKPRHTTSMGSQHQPEMIPSSTPSPAIMETPSNTPSASPSTSMSRTATPSPIPSKTPTGRAWVAGLKLMDVEKNKEVSRMFPGSVVVPHNVKKITFAAITRGDVRVVRFRLNGELTRTEFKEPFSMFGDIDGELYGWRKPIFNKWMTIQVMAKSATQKRHFKKFRVRLVRTRRRMF